MADTLDLKSSALMSVPVQVRVGLPQVKKKSKKFRNPFVIKAKAKNNSGPMRNKRSKRLNGKNKQEAYLEDNY